MARSLTIGGPEMGSLKMESQSVQDIIPFMITGIGNPNML